MGATGPGEPQAQPAAAGGRISWKHGENRRRLPDEGNRERVLLPSLDRSVPCGRLNLEVKHMENVMGVEEARRILGDLVGEVSRKREAVIITRRAREKAVLIGYDEHARLKEVAAEAASARGYTRR